MNTPKTWRQRLFVPSLIANAVLLVILIASYRYTISATEAEIQGYLSQYNQRRSEHFETLPNHRQEIVFLGNSITEGCDWAELFQNPLIKNRGINANILPDVLSRIKEVTEAQPAKVFLMIGTNDIGRGRKIADIVKDYEKLLMEFKLQSPNTAVFVQSILPVNLAKGERERDNQTIILLNKKIEALAAKYSCKYIDVHKAMLTDEQLNSNYTNDGLHLNGRGYLQWKAVLEPYLGTKAKGFFEKS
jgi:lysophospholipase L1-like esterase